MQYSEVPWKDILVDTKQFTVFKDKYPVTEGHVLFVPKVEDWEHLTECFKAAYKWGDDWVERGYCDAFNKDKMLVKKQDKLLCTHTYI